MSSGVYERKKGVHGVYIRTEDIRNRISKSLTGRKQSKETIEKRRKSLTGKKKNLSPEQRIILCERLRRMSKIRGKGWHHSDETKRKIGNKNRGENSYWWKGGVSKIHETMRDGVEMKIWRSKVFQRDDYTCQICKQRGGELNADHIRPLAISPELAYDLSNGRTLCKSCHVKTDTWGSKTNKLKYGLAYKKLK